MTTRLQKTFSFLLIFAFVCAGVELPAPKVVQATTCGTGSNITFTDIGGGECQASITTTGTQTVTIPINANKMAVEWIRAGGHGDTNAGTAGGGGEYAQKTNYSLAGLTGIYISVPASPVSNGNGDPCFAKENDSNGTDIARAIGGKISAFGLNGVGGTGGTGDILHAGGQGTQSGTAAGGGAGGPVSNGGNGSGNTATGGQGIARLTYTPMTGRTLRLFSTSATQRVFLTSGTSWTVPSGG